MPLRPHLCLLALLIFFPAGFAHADARIEDFYGSYTGFGLATDTSGPFMRTPRDFELAIGPLKGGGFEIVWATLKRKGSDPNALEEEVSEHRAFFKPADKPDLFRGVNNGALFEPGPVTWARLEGDILIIYRMEVEENGLVELHVYERMLTAKGLELFFTATRDNKQIRSVRGSYRKR